MERNEGKDRSLETLIGEAREHLARLGYHPDTQRHYDRAWRGLTTFAATKGAERMSAELAEAFLEQCGAAENGEETSAAHRHGHLKAAVWHLLDFHLHGCFQRRRSTRAPIEFPEELARVLTEYDRFCIEERKLSPRTMRGRLRNVERLLMHHASCGSTDVRTINVETLSAFMTTRCHLEPRTLASLASDLRSFLRFLSMKELLPASLVEQVPKVRIWRDARIPDVWRAEDVAALLAAVDRGSPLGKRDYAILLLAARLGLRAGDIRELQLENLHWDQARIELTQSKTGRPIVLPLTEEVGEAVIAYLRDGRPPTTHRQVFLRHRAPFEPFGQNNNLHNIITKYRCSAGIELPKKSRTGLHSLRHTVATRLLEAGVALDTISGVMGHITPETTRLYTKVDLAALRSAALELEEVQHG